MRTARCLPALIALVVLAAPARPDLLLGVPDMRPSWVDETGALHEDWGVVALRLETPSGARLVSQRYEVSPAPTVITTFAAGPVTLTATAYRAPIWPDGVDVLTARLRNTGDEEVEARLQLLLPEQVDVGERVGQLGGRAVVGLAGDPQPARRERRWGCTGGVVPMPGWARPEVECDPAFRNIRAGLWAGLCN